MTPDQWRKLQELFDEVTQSPPGEREAALKRLEATGENSALLAELRRLVEHADPGAEFLRPIPGLFTGSSIHSGEVVAGRFEIVKLIGRGGMGEVFEALDRKLSERVAIKVIAPEYARDTNLLERFLREVQIARRISHPNICRIHDLGEHGGVPYLSMELLEGETLALHLQQGPLALNEWEEIAQQLFAGLRAAHTAGVIHRDLKPSNLMLVDSRLVILDFGLARPILPQGDSGLTRSGMLMGTLDWMAPEQLVGEGDERSDLYSAALILLHALRGKPPENESGGLAGALRRATGDTDFRKQLPASMPAAWRYVILRCLERDPNRRPARAQQVLDLLEKRRTLLFASISNLTRSRWFRIPAMSAMLMALVIFGLRYLNQEPLKPGSLIMVATTNNSTGEAKFDGITTLLRTDVAQSNRFNVWDGQRLGDVLRLMRRDVQSKPDSKDWREIAFREKAPLLVHSTVSKVSDGYMVAIRSEQIGAVPDPPVHTWEKTFTSAGPATLYEAVHEAATWIRSNAGENGADLSANNRLPQDITTDKWEALQMYDRAQSLSAAQRANEAIPQLQAAIQIDPDFAMALMRLGDILNAQYRSEEGFRFWQQASALARTQALSEHEKLNIQSRYAVETRDFEGALPTLRRWVEHFPNDSLAHQFLASTLLSLGQYEEAIQVARTAQTKFGPTVFGTSVLIRAFAAKKQTAEIEPQLQILEQLSSHTLVLQYRGMLAAMQGDYESASTIFRKLISSTKGRESSRAVGLLANLEADRGNMDEAGKILQAAIPKDKEEGEAGLAALKTVALAFLEGYKGNKGTARGLAQQSVSIQPSPQVVVESVAILARNGYPADAKRTMQQFPAGEGPRFEAARLRMDGEILAATGNIQKAADAMNKAVRADQTSGPKEYQARVLEMAGQRDQAKLIYQQIVDTPWIIWGSPGDELPGVRFLAQEYLRQAKGN